MFKRDFLFAESCRGANVTCVEAEDLYRPGKGYGFVTEQNRREQELLKIPELNAGFDTVYWYQDEELTHIRQSVSGCYLEPGEMDGRRIPLCFKADVPRQGNYRVNVTIQPAEDMRDFLLFTGRRRLACKADILHAGSPFNIELTVNVCDIVPRGKKRIYTDKAIDITVLADKPCISEIQIAEVSCPVLYIAGDSTVTDQNADYPYAPGTSYAGWGQMLTAFLDSKTAVSNHSHSGLTTESFRREGHYAVVDQYSRPRDYFLFQFGHNDQKLEHLRAEEGYRSNLVRYINECRDKGAYPLLVTPVARNSWRGDDGTYNDLLEQYAQSCLEIGQVMDVPVLELHAKSVDFIKHLGLEASKRYFYPGDYTHNNDYGAYQMARFVAEEIVRTCSEHAAPGYRALAEHVTEGLGEWEPSEHICLAVKPAIYADRQNPNGGEELLADIRQLESPLTRVDALDMVIRTARFFPTNVYNDMFTDVVGHEWYAGTVECGCQNGILPPQMCEGHMFFPEKEITLEEFLVFAMNGYKSRKPFPAETPCRYDTQCAAYAVPYVRAACAAAVIAADGSEDMRAGISRGRAVQICRSLHI